ncbi:TPA_asm: hypothetical protein [Pseudomonas phage vB_PaeS-D14B]|nr:TPA_asm: hypothetical protein [Pseudomonas phage vB_PaeS-D14B]
MIINKHEDDTRLSGDSDKRKQWDGGFYNRYKRLHIRISNSLYPNLRLISFSN